MKYRTKLQLNNPFLLLLVYIAANSTLFGQDTILNEDFSTASGTTPPLNWTIQTTLGDPADDVWHFDNPGRRSPAAPISEPFACFDSDKYSDNSQSEEVYLVSPVFNATTSGEVFLEFDQYFLSGYGSACAVEIYDGADWNIVYSSSTTTENPLQLSLNITSVIQNVTNAQIRFKWTGDYSWYWMVDNITLYAEVSAIPDNLFSYQSSIDLEDVYQSVTEWGDYDNDGDLDILLAGSDGSIDFTKIYRNNGFNSFSEQTDIVLPGLQEISFEWGDYDNDGDLDILFIGRDNSVNEYKSMIYRNNGNNSFTEQTDIILSGVMSGETSWMDYDNDGDLDITLSGDTDGFASLITKIYRNEGNNTFTEQADILLPGIANGRIAWGDYDNDLDLDLLITGHTGLVGTWQISRIYRNDGNNTFSEQTDIVLYGVNDGGADWGDYDSDGDLDILLTGGSPQGKKSKIYRNDGGNIFTELSELNLQGVDGGDAKWGDYDNDGDLDFAMNGDFSSSTLRSLSNIYRNDGNDTFSELSDIGLDSAESASLAWGDYDMDGDIDLLISGRYYGSGPPFSRLYRNNSLTTNTAPSVPSTVSAQIIDGKFHINWNASSDAETPSPGLTYNLRIGTTPGGSEIMSAMSNADGSRLIAAKGNVGQSTSWVINLPATVPDDIYFSVQAIDNSYLGSAWSPEQSELNNLIADFTPADACQRNDIQFQDKSLTLDNPIVSYKWRFIEDGVVMDSSTLQNPVYAYQSYLGVQLAELTVTNSIGEKATRTKIIQITASPLSDFSAPAVCEGNLTDIANLTNANSTSITDYLWDFGDGTPTSNVQDPVNHNYSAGTYQVSLTVSSTNGCSLTTTKDVIVAAKPPKVLSVNGSTTFCSSENTSLSAGEDIYFSYQWKNNNAIIPDSTNRTIYPRSSGTYSVSIINTAAANCFQDSDPVEITVSPSPPVLNIDPPTGTEYCMNDIASQLETANFAGLSYNWSVDGILATSGSNTFLPQKSGTYTLSVTNAGNCSQASPDTVHNLIIHPIPAVPNVVSPDPEFCEGEDFTMHTAYEAGLAYQWLKDGNPILDSTSARLSPLESGSYSVRIGMDGCSNASSPVEVKVFSLPPAPSILANGATTFCQGDSSVLSVVHDEAYNYEWRLNGGLVSSDSSVFSAKYSGSYELEVLDTTGCKSVSISPVDIIVIDSPPVLSLDKNGPTTLCEGDSVKLSVSNDPAYTYQWMQDGFSISGETSSSLQASEQGDYKLRTTNSNDCQSLSRAEAISVISGVDAPLISALSDTVFCEGGSVQLSTPQNENFSYSWKKNGGDLNSHSTQYEVAESGIYHVEISMDGAEECSRVSSKEIEVVVLNNPAPFLASAFETELCAGDSTKMSVENTPDYKYQWFRNDIPIPGETSYEYTVENDGSYTVRAEDPNRCSSISVNSVSITVVGKPNKPVISERDGLSLICPEEEVTLQLADHNDIYHYKWLRNGQDLNETGPELSGPLPAAEYSVLTWVGNCSAESDRYHITWKPTPDKPELYAHGPSAWYLACSNDSAEIYRWYYDEALIQQGSDHIYVADQELGQYRVEISEDGDCFRSSNVLSIPDNIYLGTDGIDPFQNLRIYPNPTGGPLSLEMENDIFGDLIINVYGTKGTSMINIMVTKETEHFKTQIDLSSLPGAIYLVELTLKEHRFTGKIVVE